MRTVIPAVASVALWVAGIAIVDGSTSAPSPSASGDKVLAWAQHHTNPILIGCWLFMCGCVCFVWFLATLRTRLAAAEGAGATITTTLFGGGIATAVFALGMQAGDMNLAINKSDLHPATAATLHNLGDTFFVGAELFAIVPLVSLALLAFRTRVVPRWWGAFSVLLAVWLVIGPIGWLGLLFGMPVWTLGTAALAGLRRPAAFPVALLAGA